MLEFAAEDGVEDPIEAEDWIDDHSGVVYPRTFVAQYVPEERVVRVRVEERPVHGDVPDGTVDGVDGARQDEESFPVESRIDTIEG